MTKNQILLQHSQTNCGRWKERQTEIFKKNCGRREKDDGKQKKNRREKKRKDDKDKLGIFKK